MSVDVYIDIVLYIIPIIGGMYISWSLYWYCIYHANNWGDMCKLLVLCGPLRPRVGGCSSMYISLQQLNERDLRNSITDTLEPRAFQIYST